MGKVYALLVGINAYPPGVNQLGGCVEDVAAFQAYLEKKFPNTQEKERLSLKVLKDGEATRANVISLFQTHLGKAKADDVAVFQFCGHGAQHRAAEEFRAYSNNGLDEGILCYDSRLDGNYDLADKELAVLVARAARRGAHVAVILDCCHSGSATRDAPGEEEVRTRTTAADTRPRPLESYLTGYYVRQRESAKADGLPEKVFVPKARHVLLAACDRRQTAKEVRGRGVFTSRLLSVLEQAPENLTYADLLTRCRASVQSRKDDQDPQLESVAGFDALSGFLGEPAVSRGRRYNVRFEAGSRESDPGVWTLEAGSIHGLPNDGEAPVTLALFAEGDPATSVGAATATRIGGNKSQLELHFPPGAATRFQAVLTSSPNAPLRIRFEGAPETLEALQTAIDGDGLRQVLLTSEPVPTPYKLAVEGDTLMLSWIETGRAIQGAKGAAADLAGAAARLAPVLNHVARWERVVALQNPKTELVTSRVSFELIETLADGSEPPHPETAVTLDFVNGKTGWRTNRTRMEVRNGAGQRLHVALLYCAQEFAVVLLNKEEVEPSTEPVILYGNEPEHAFALAEKQDISVDRFKLLVTTEAIDDFFLVEEFLELGLVIDPAVEPPVTRGLAGVSPNLAKVRQDDWFTKDLQVTVVRREDPVGPAATASAGG